VTAAEAADVGDVGDVDDAARVRSVALHVVAAPRPVVSIGTRGPFFPLGGRTPRPQHRRVVAPLVHHAACSDAKTPAKRYAIFSDGFSVVRYQSAVTVCDHRRPIDRCHIGPKFSRREESTLISK